MKIEELSKYSKNNKNDIEKSQKCACYFCLETFDPKQIKDWIDSGQTAMCPKCKIDSVLADSVVDWDRDFLNKANEYWF